MGEFRLMVDVAGTTVGAGEWPTRGAAVAEGERLCRAEPSWSWRVREVIRETDRRPLPARSGRR